MTYDQDLDCADLLCPLPVLKARKRLMGMAPGAVLRVVTTDPMAIIDLPHFCVQSGHVYLASAPLDHATAHFIRAGGPGMRPRIDGFRTRTKQKGGPIGPPFVFSDQPP